MLCDWAHGLSRGSLRRTLPREPRPLRGSPHQRASREFGRGTESCARGAWRRRYDGTLLDRAKLQRRSEHGIRGAPKHVRCGVITSRVRRRLGDQGDCRQYLPSCSQCVCEPVRRGVNRCWLHCKGGDRVAIGSAAGSTSRDLVWAGHIPTNRATHARASGGGAPLRSRRTALANARERKELLFDPSTNAVPMLAVTRRVGAGGPTRCGPGLACR